MNSQSTLENYKADNRCVYCDNVADTFILDASTLDEIPICSNCKKEIKEMSS